MTILSVSEQSRDVFLFRSNDRYNLHESVPMGTGFYLHRNAAGKAMLAKHGDEVVEHLDGEYAESVRRAASELSLQLEHN